MKYMKLDQKGSAMAEYIWVDANGGVRSKSKVRRCIIALQSLIRLIPLIKIFDFHYSIDSCHESPFVACWESSVAQPNALNLAQAPHAIVLGIVSGAGNLRAELGGFLPCASVKAGARSWISRFRLLGALHIPEAYVAYCPTSTRPSWNGSSFVCLPTLGPVCIRTAPVCDGEKVSATHCLMHAAKWLRALIEPFRKESYHLQLRIRIH